MNALAFAYQYRLLYGPFLPQDSDPGHRVSPSERPRRHSELRLRQSPEPPEAESPPSVEAEARDPREGQGRG
jgi:hypothetical protein